MNSLPLIFLMIFLDLIMMCLLLLLMLLKMVGSGLAGLGLMIRFGMICCIGFILGFGFSSISLFVMRSCCLDPR